MLIGSEGVSHTFMVGICELSDPVVADEKLRELRGTLLLDPYFRGVPSMRASARKTALCFHAKDDLPEVRREVFRLIHQFKPEMHVAIRRKAALLRASALLDDDRTRRRDANAMYNGLVESAFASLTIRDAKTRVLFARRGKSARNVALLTSIARAQAHNSDGQHRHRPFVAITSGTPSEWGGLQVTDYLLWALQRLFERRETRYFESVAQFFRVIIDLDDHRNGPLGARFEGGNQLSLETLLPVVPG